MRMLALATDYDRTLATEGRVSDATLAALLRFRSSGRKLILVTGRRLPEVLEIFPGYGVFDRIVAENGALLYEPATGLEKLLAPTVDPRLVELLADRGINPLVVGRSIVATTEQHSTTVTSAIRELGLDLELISNRGSVMILPVGISKETGAEAALQSLGLSRQNLAAIGDAENDSALLAGAGLAVAVSNALPSLKARADRVTREPEGAGVAELIDEILSDEEAAPGSPASDSPPRPGCRST